MDDKDDVTLIKMLTKSNKHLVTGLPLYLETWKYLEFDNLGKKPGTLNKNLKKT